MADLPMQVTLCVIGSERWTPSSMLHDAFRSWYAIRLTALAVLISIWHCDVAARCHSPS
jgi:hypothetical protein